MGILKQFQRYHQDDVGRKIEEIIDDVNQLDSVIPTKLDKTGGSITGDLNITGKLTQGTYVFDSDITISNLPIGLKCNYAHARVSNGKLNIVIALYATPFSSYNAITSAITIASIPLTSDILSKLYTITPESASLAYERKQNAKISESLSSTICIVISKTSTGIDIKFAPCEAFAASEGFMINRFEFNFTLS